MTASALPHPRRTPIKSGSNKEWTLIDYLDKHIGLIQRRYAKRGAAKRSLEGIGGGATMSGITADTSTVEDFSEKDLEGIQGYESFREVGADVEKLIDLVWVSGTRTCTLPSYLNYLGFG
jgi:hypothetical protein